MVTIIKGVYSGDFYGLPVVVRGHVDLGSDEAVVDGWLGF